MPGGEARPASRQTIFADGSADETYREGLDLELSHWVPNRTPARYKADTSTAICLAFVADPLPGDWDLAVNNHLDVDGVLSLYVLGHPERALAHREALAGAARMGDFWDYGEGEALALYQGLASYQAELGFGRLPLPNLYARCFERVDALLGTRLETSPLDAAIQRLEDGTIARTVVSERLVAYLIPRVLAEKDLAKALHVPAFNQPLDDAAWLPPQARNRLDRERVQLVSVELADGWHHDLYYPGYRWAETPGSWAAPGFEFAGSTNGYRVAHPGLERAVQALQAADQGSWTLADQLTPFGSIPGRNYPVILTCPDSRLTPAAVAASLADVY